LRQLLRNSLLGLQKINRGILKITASEIKRYHVSSPDYDETETMKQKLADLRNTRKPIYLTSLEFEEILKWKLRSQYGRQQDARKVNTEEIIRYVTGLALNISHINQDYKLELQIGILSSIRGVGIPFASAILALIFPGEYAVIDFRVWRQVFGYDATSFTVSDYKKYMKVLRNFSTELGWPVQEVDLAIWTYDLKNNS
jgi:thermostable 8-oxoguanine DNA glycosylase